MSDVISFRLDKDNPREEKARQVLKSWYEEGYSLRYIMTEALLKLGDSESYFYGECLIRDLTEKFSRLSQQLEQCGQEGDSKVKTVNSGSSNTELSDSFIQSIKKIARPCVKFAE